ncbi:MAG TPA: tetratricopeptide repeat protein [Polyangiaceae bacterium]
MLGPPQSDTQEPDAMNEYEIEEIKREIVESRALTIKTNNLVNALAADLKSISKRQQGAERKVVLNSATAYVVTIAVLLVFVKLTWDIRIETVKSENKETRDQLEAVQKDIKVDQEREEAQKRASRQAGEFYQLIVQSKRQEVIAAYPDVVKLDLTPTERAVFDAAVERAKNELSLIAYQTGVDHIRMARWHEAQQAFRESLKYKSDAAHSPQANLQLSRALIQLGLHRDAIPILMQLSEASADKEVMDEATLQLAEAELAIQAWNDAKNTLRAFIRRFPNSPHINDARAKLAEVSLYH